MNNVRAFAVIFLDQGIINLRPRVIILQQHPTVERKAKLKWEQGPGDKIRLTWKLHHLSNRGGIQLTAQQVLRTGHTHTFESVGAGWALHPARTASVQRTQTNKFPFSLWQRHEVHACMSLKMVENKHPAPHTTQRRPLHTLAQAAGMSASHCTVAGAKYTRTQCCPHSCASADGSAAAAGLCASMYADSRPSFRRAAG